MRVGKGFAAGIWDVGTDLCARMSVRLSAWLRLCSQGGEMEPTWGSAQHEISSPSTLPSRKTQKYSAPSAKSAKAKNLAMHSRLAPPDGTFFSDGFPRTPFCHVDRSFLSHSGGPCA